MNNYGYEYTINGNERDSKEPVDVIINQNIPLKAQMSQDNSEASLVLGQIQLKPILTSAADYYSTTIWARDEYM